MNRILTVVKSKYVLAAFGAIVAVSAFGGTSLTAQANTCAGAASHPVFNAYPLTYDSSQDCHDLPLIDARDLTGGSERDQRYSASQAEHDAGINASVGDTVRVSIYFDNGATDDPSLGDSTTAQNVVVASTLDSSASTSHSIAGSLSASNAATVTSTSAHQGGNITVNSSTPTTLQYVPGSTQVCLQYNDAVESGVNLSQTCGTDAQGQPKILVNLPDGITSGGVSLGYLKPCFPYSGEVVYSVNVIGQSAPSNGSLTITKNVEDLTTNNNQVYTSSVNANTGDTVEYQIITTNNSNTTLNNVVVNDPQISGISFNNSNSSVDNIGTLAPGQSSTELVDAQVTASGGTLVNTATATASNASSAQASATVFVSQQSNCSINGNAVSVNKLVKNLTQGISNFSSTVNANSGDRVAFEINIANNSSSTLNNVTMNENMPNGLSYVNGTANFNGNQFTGSFINTTANLGTIPGNSTASFYFEATVNAYGSGYGQTITNTTYVTSNCGSGSSSANVVLNGNSIPVNSNGVLTITKFVSNLTHGNAMQKSVTAFTNDQVEYQITVSNPSNVTDTNVTLNDQLPGGLNYISSTNGNGYNGNNGFVSIGNLFPGQQDVITITATVAAAAGNTITNTASAGASNAATVYDTANVTVQGVAGASIAMSYSKSAFNDTKNVDATSVPADKQDFITYTLTATNDTSTPATNFVVSDDLTQVLNYATVTDDGGGTVTGNTISWPAVTVNPNSSIQETFKVRVNYTLPNTEASLYLVNTYGNTVTIKLNNPEVLGASIVAPTTGPAAETAFALGFASLLTVGFYFLRNGKLLKFLPKVKVKIH